jgi:hypothetical protein
MQLIDRPWPPEHEIDHRPRSPVGVIEQGTVSFPEQTNGMQYRRHAYAWAEQISAFGQHRTSSASPVATTDPLIARAINAWPRILQIGSLGLAFCAAILASAHVLSAASGLALGCFGLTVMFFGNFAAYRRGDAARLVGPTIAVIGAWGSFVITVGIGINALLGA